MSGAQAAGGGSTVTTQEPDRGRPTALTWSETVVDGDRVVTGTAGQGPSALFLHGWGLRPHAYARAVTAMSLAGCRVVAPALPGFGGTPELPTGQRSFAGYAAWVARFLDATDLDHVALVAGHSFGGGVATAFVHGHPRRASSLLLLNAVGSPVWGSPGGSRRAMADRPVWDWGRHLVADLVAAPGPARLAPPILADFGANLASNPFGLWRTGEFIRRADLLAELRAIGARRLPVEVLWSDRDRLVPRAAFDAVRRAVGVEGQVVEGGHGWLIGRPEAAGDAALRCLVEAGAVGVPDARAG